jgi:hypothetical protein
MANSVAGSFAAVFGGDVVLKKLLGLVTLLV